MSFLLPAWYNNELSLAEQVWSGEQLTQQSREATGQMSNSYSSPGGATGPEGGP